MVEHRNREMRAHDPDAPTIINLRAELQEVRQEVAEETNERIRRQGHELRDARLVVFDLTWQETAVALDLHRANTRLPGAQKLIDDQEDLLHQQGHQRVDHTPHTAKGRVAPPASSGGVDPAAKLTRHRQDQPIASVLPQPGRKQKAELESGY